METEKMKSQRIHRMIASTVSFIILVSCAIVFLAPIVIVVMNSFKKKVFLRAGMAFDLVTKESFYGWKN